MGKRKPGQLARLRKAVELLELSLQEINIANQDRNPNRYAQIDGMVKYGLDIAICLRGDDEFPDKPNRDKFI